MIDQDYLTNLKDMALSLKEKREEIQKDSQTLTKEMYKILSEDKSMSKKEKKSLVDEIFVDGADDVIRYYLKNTIIENVNGIMDDIKSFNLK